jgi:hypothetical protein
MHSVRRLLAATTCALFSSGLLHAQGPTSTLPPLNFSGILFGSYNFQESTTPNQLNRQIDNVFVLDRAYLTFRLPAGDHASIRITTDVYQSTENTVNGWTIRAKYAYLQYDGDKSGNGGQLAARVGILQNVVIDHMETLWPRYLSTTPVERQGYFSGADAGIAALYTMPDKLGEIYTTVVNGPGFTSRETDRFKDFGMRVSLTPFAANKEVSLLNTFTLTAWGYKGALASAFVNGGAGTNGAVGDALDRSRAGLFAGIKDPRLMIAAEVSQRHDGGELGANTAASPRTVTETTGRLMAAYSMVRPFAFTNSSGTSPFGLIARYDFMKPTASTTGFAVAPPTDNAYHTMIAGVLYDLNAKIQLSLDYQEILASSNGASTPPATAIKGYYAHFFVNF